MVECPEYYHREHMVAKMRDDERHPVPRDSDSGFPGNDFWLARRQDKRCTDRRDTFKPGHVPGYPSSFLSGQDPGKRYRTGTLALTGVRIFRSSAVLQSSSSHFCFLCPILQMFQNMCQNLNFRDDLNHFFIERKQKRVFFPQRDSGQQW